MVEMLNGVRCLYEGGVANASTLNGWGQDYIRAECEHGTLELDRRKLTVLISGPDGRYLKRERLSLRKDRPIWLNAAIAEDFCDWLRGARLRQPITLTICSAAPCYSQRSSRRALATQSTSNL